MACGRGKANTLKASGGPRGQRDELGLARSRDIATLVLFDKRALQWTNKSKEHE